MTSLKRRAAALENEFAHKQDFKFKAEARRNAMIGLWAAAIMGHADVDAYAMQLATAAVDGDEMVLRRLREDFDAADIVVRDDELRNKMVTLLQQATAALQEA